ncbi:MAG: Crp/Fnr family transcriptional regulator [Flavobacteriaceae bacterium]|jgi:CRP/FNR family transcriptional regulator|nr:Crp/Fnr family transcriptional regulator [Flavobacteriaceae bacterium]
MLHALHQSYGGLFEKALIEDINQVGTIKEVPEGFLLIDFGQYIRSMPLLVSGAIKVLREDTDGNELLLYFLEQGETCAMTLNCCLGQTKSQIRAIAETDTKLIMIPVEKMEEWTGKYRSWRNYVFESYHNRLMEMLESIDSIAFLRMDQRLLKYLREKVQINQNKVIHATHQDIADDLHTSRVVVSRLLKSLENSGVIRLHRNNIEVLEENWPNL